MPRSHRKPKLWVHLLIFFSCVGFPAIITALAPVCEMSFSRIDGVVTAVVQTKVFFLIPYRIERVEGVKDLDESITFNQIPTTDPGVHPVRPDDQGFFVIRGRSGEVRVKVSPYDLADVLKKADAFLRDPAQPELRLFAVANWKMGVFAGGAFSIFTLLYIFGLLSLIWVRLFGRHRPANKTSKEEPRSNLGGFRK